MHSWVGSVVVTMPSSFMLGAKACLPRMLWRFGCIVALCACGPHAELKQQTTSQDCGACHSDEAAKTTQPPHLQAMFSKDCGSCHDEKKWLPAQGFVHTAAFPLTLAHDGPACVDCHAQTYAPGAVPNQCVDCHRDQAAAVANPVHAGLSENCFACHRSDAFLPSTFIHSWPLNGAHVQTACTGCHIGAPAQYEGTATACASCHLEDRARADLTVQGHGGFPSNCESCHNSEKF